MFRRRKKAAEYKEEYYEEDYYEDYYYEDYYYDDDEDDDNGYYSEDDKDEDSEKTSTQKTSESDEPSLVDKVVIKQLEEQRAETEQLKKENAELKNKFATVSALPKHYQQLEADSMGVKAELTKAQEELEQMAEKVTRAEVTARHYQREINVKQTEIDQLTEKVLNAGPVSEEDEALSVANQRLTESLATSQSEAERLNSEIAQLKQQLLDNVPDFNKDDIADVMLEAKANARQIIEQSTHEANRIVKDAELELIEITRKAEELYRNVYVTKMDSANAFEELLNKLSVLSASEQESD